MLKLHSVMPDLTLLSLLLSLDQLSKYLAQLLMPWQQRVAFLPGFVSFFYTRNTGAAFSILSDQRWLLSVVGCGALLAMVYWHGDLTEGRLTMRVAWIMVFAGALGNLIDRVLHGSVVDFLIFDFVQFPVFNVADIAITCGAGIYILVLLHMEYMGRRGLRP